VIDFKQVFLFLLGILVFSCKTETNDVELLFNDSELVIEIEHIACLGGNSFRRLEIKPSDSGEVIVNTWLDGYISSEPVILPYNNQRKELLYKMLDESLNASTICTGSDEFKVSGKNYKHTYTSKSCYTWEYLDSLGVNSTIN